MRQFFAVLMLLGLIAVACKSQQNGTMKGPESASFDEFPADAQVISFETIKQAGYCGVQEERQVLVQTTEDWEVLWKEVCSNQMPAPPVPAVDFSSQAVIACFMGARNTGGYVLDIQSLQTKGNTAYVSVKYTKPGPNCFVTEAITQPYQIVSLPKGNLSRTSFQVVKVINPCGE